MTRWSIADLADAAEAGLTAAARRFDLEQAPSGLDALDEIEIHPLLAEAFRGTGYGVEREHRYPADRERRRETEGERCDLVLTPEGRDLRPPAGKATLFDDPGAVDFEDAFWLEVKVVAQYTEEGANRNYASQLLSTVGRDVRKLSKDRGILHAGLLIILFVAEPIIADHDLGVWQDRCLERHLPIGAPSRRVVPVTDRLGNRLCVAALYPVSHY